MSVRGKQATLKFHRKTARNISSAYSTVSTEAALVLAVLPPINLKVSERTDPDVTKRNLVVHLDARQEARRDLLDPCQVRWDTTETGRWTFRLIRDIQQLATKRHDESSFYLTGNP